jgi:hypothetical protein
MIFLKFKNKSKFKNPEPTISELEDKLDIRNIRKAEHSKGRCHNYALKNYVISDCIKESMDKVLFILKTRFKEIKLNQIKKNDICCFFKKDKLCNVVLKHLGVIVKPSKDLNKILIKNKLGTAGIY